MSNVDQYSGEVTIPLRVFNDLEARSRELETVKRQLKEERGKTWKLFGNFFEQKRTLYELTDYGRPSQLYVIEVKQPLTKLVVDGYNLDSTWDVLAIYRKLVEDHILDVVKAVDIAKLNPKVQR